MFALLKKIWLSFDECILKKFEKISYKWQGVTGKNNFQLVINLLYLSLFITLVSIVDFFWHISVFTAVGWSFLLPSAILLFILLMFIPALISLIESIGNSITSLLEIKEMGTKRYFSFMRHVCLIGIIPNFFTLVLLTIVYSKIGISFFSSFYSSLLRFVCLQFLNIVILLVVFYFASCEPNLPVKKVSVLITG